MKQSFFENPLERRQFLRLSATGFGLMAAAPIASALDWLDAPVSVAGKLYRAAPGGSLKVSTDGGLNWLQVARFGGEVEIAHIEGGEPGWVRVYLQKQGRGFWLRSNNDTHWQAVDTA